MLTARYTEQMPFVGTPVHRYCMVMYASQHNISKADTTRQSLNAFFDLEDGEFPTANDERVADFEAWVKAGKPEFWVGKH